MPMTCENQSSSITNTATHPAVLVHMPASAMHDLITNKMSALGDVDKIQVKSSSIEIRITCNGEFSFTPVIAMVQTGYTATSPARAGDNASYSIQELLDSMFDKPLDYYILPTRTCQRTGPETTHQCRLVYKVNTTRWLKKWVKNYMQDPRFVQGTQTPTLLMAGLFEFPSEEALVAYWRTISKVDFVEMTKSGKDIL